MIGRIALLSSALFLGAVGAVQARSSLCQWVYGVMTDRKDLTAKSLS